MYCKTSRNSAHRAVAIPVKKASWSRGHHPGQGGQRCLEFAQGGDFVAGDGIEAGKTVGCVGETDSLIGTVLGYRLGDGIPRQLIDGVAALEYSVK